MSSTARVGLQSDHSNIIHEFVFSNHGSFALATSEKRETFWFNVDLSCKNLLEVQSSKKGSGWQESQRSKRKSGFRT